VSALFNAICSHCGQQRPRCATVTLIRDHRSIRAVLCEVCRKVLAGEYRLVTEHKGKK
jgi:protein-arginine kinase activator protein McsA